MGYKLQEYTPKLKIPHLPQKIKQPKNQRINTIRTVLHVHKILIKLLFQL